MSITAAVLAAVTEFLFLGSDTTLLLSLKSHDAQLSNLAETFRPRMVPKEVGKQKAPIVSFYETKPLYLLGWLSIGLVSGCDQAPEDG